MAEKFFWADEIANKLIKERGKKSIYVCASGITPSGTIHIGSVREVITTDMVVRALQDKRKKVRFVYSWDDFDRFRKVPKGLPKEYEKYIGVPVSDIPSPFPREKKKSYAEHFEKEFESSLKKIGITPEFIYQNIMNKKCKYARLIKKALDKKEKIIEILNRYRKEPLAKGWYPITVYCEKCKKDFTKILSVKEYIIEYECKCGYKNKFDYRKKGLVSAKWRVDWPMRWFYEKVDFEPGGIDHSVEGGSYTTGKEIIKEVYDDKAPHYVFYDWIKLKGGKEFASSTGNTLTLDQVEEVYEPEILRYLFVGTKPQSGFQISFDNDVIKIYEDYDALERKYYTKKVNPREKRMYELSQLPGKISKKQLKKTSFRHLINLIQIGKVPKQDKVRAEKVKNWIEKYAPEEFKFQIQNKINVKLNSKEKKSLLALRDVLKQNKTLTEEKLFNEFYKICKEKDITNKDFFKSAYKVILNKERGPRLASLILNIGQDKIAKLLNQIK